MAAHATLGPSGAHRWMPCPGSIVLEEPFPNGSTIFADEGTAAHELAARVLLGGGKAIDHIGAKIEVGDNTFTVDIDMAKHVQDYVNLVRQEAAGGELLVEQRLPISQLTGEDDAGGTADAVILNVATRALKIVDLKYGMGVKVDALDNPQLQMYALAATDHYSLLGDFDEVSMLIHQPRLNHVGEFHVATAQLEAFRGDVADAAARVDEATAQHGVMPKAEWAEAYLQPGQKQCKFCRAKSVCPALRREVADTVGRASVSDFAKFMPVAVTDTTEADYLSLAMDKVALIELWCKAVREETERRLLNGKPVAGYKLVQGRKGNAQWTDETAVAKLMKSFRLRNEEMYDWKLISPSQAKKLLGNTPRRWEKLDKLTTRSAGKPSVVHATDKRDEMSFKSAVDDFRSLVKTEN